MLNGMELPDTTSPGVLGAQCADQFGKAGESQMSRAADDDEESSSWEEVDSANSGSDKQPTTARSRSPVIFSQTDGAPSTPKVRKGPSWLITRSLKESASSSSITITTATADGTAVLVEEPVEVAEPSQHTPDPAPEQKSESERSSTVALDDRLQAMLQSVFASKEERSPCAEHEWNDFFSAKRARDLFLQELDVRRERQAELDSIGFNAMGVAMTVRVI